MSLSTSHLRPRLADYAFSAGLVPVMMLMPTFTHTNATSPLSRQSMVYRTELLRNTSEWIEEVQQLLRRFPADSSEGLGLTFLEAPEYASYQDAYRWEPVEVVIIESQPVEVASPLKGEPPEIWR